MSLDKKYFLLIPTLVLPLLCTEHTAYAQHFTSILDMGNLVACGQVVARDEKGLADAGGPLYTIKIENYYNGNITNSTLTAIGSEDSNGPVGMASIQVGHTALFYVNVGEKHSMLLPQTTTVSKCSSVFDPTPLGQYRFGVGAQDVYCSNGYNLVIKSEDGSPACARPGTANILIERGWGKPLIDAANAGTGNGQTSSLTITLQNNNNSIHIHAGDSFLLKLGDSFTWNITIDNQTVVSRVPNVMVIRGAQGIYDAHNLGEAVLTAIGDPLCRQTMPQCELASIMFRLNIIVS